MHSTLNLHDKEYDSYVKLQEVRNKEDILNLKANEISDTTHSIHIQHLFQGQIK